jgi:polysaccharide export outer membrane protein
MISEDLQAACRTESELAAEIRTLYLEYKKDPSVEVFVTDFQSRPVSVIGAINSPGQYRLQRQVRLLELLTFSGGPATRAGRTINIVHSIAPNVCVAPSDKATSDKVSDGAEEISVYSLNDTMAGKREANPFVQAGDIVQVPEADQIFIIGHVSQPQAIALRDKPITISRAIAMAGGAARDGKTSNIKIIRQMPDGTGKREFFINLKDIQQRKAEDIALMANDIVEVPASVGKTVLGFFTGAIGPTISSTAVRSIGVP